MCVHNCFQLEFPDNYLLCTLNLNIFGSNAMFGRLNTANNRSDWMHHSSIHEVNACYAPQENSVGKHSVIVKFNI